MFYLKFFVLLIFSYYVCTMIHELGHAFFVYITKNKILEIKIGFYGLKTGVCIWTFKNWDNYKRDAILILLGGCIANFFTLIISIPLFLYFYYVGFKIWCLFFFTISISSLVQLFNLNPTKEESDGWNIKQFINKEKKCLQEREAENLKLYYENRKIIQNSYGIGITLYKSK